MWVVSDKTLEFRDLRDFTYLRIEAFFPHALVWPSTVPALSDIKIIEFKVVTLELDLKGQGPSGQRDTVIQTQVWQRIVFKFSWGGSQELREE